MPGAGSSSSGSSSRRRSTQTAAAAEAAASVFGGDSQGQVGNVVSNFDAVAALAGTERASDDTVSEELMFSTLYRLTAGLPQHELMVMAKEARECEDALKREIRTLEESIGINRPSSPESDNEEAKHLRNSSAASADAADDSKVETTPKKRKHSENGGGRAGEVETDRKKKAGGNATKANSSAADPSHTVWATDPAGGLAYMTSADAMLASELTPPDRYFTASALLGRLREPLETPPPPNSTLALTRRPTVERKKNSKKKKDSDATAEDEAKAKKRKMAEKYKALISLQSNPMYTKKLTDTAPLLAVWKRISTHRTSAVFRRPVNAKDAPGYTDRILFPMDLSLIRKMITTGIVASFSDLHQRIGLICHNCVKFNGRESDYGILTRDFEAYVDDSIVAAVNTASAAAAKSAASSEGTSSNGTSSKTRK